MQPGICLSFALILKAIEDHPLVGKYVLVIYWQLWIQALFVWGDPYRWATFQQDKIHLHCLKSIGDVSVFEKRLCLDALGVETLDLQLD